MSHREAEVVWLTEERCFGTVEGALGAYYTTIKYIKGGIEFEVLMENDEFKLLEDMVEYDDED